MTLCWAEPTAQEQPDQANEIDRASKTDALFEAKDSEKLDRTDSISKHNSTLSETNSRKATKLSEQENEHSRQN